MIFKAIKNQHIKYRDIAKELNIQRKSTVDISQLYEQKNNRSNTNNKKN